MKGVVDMSVTAEVIRQQQLNLAVKLASNTNEIEQALRLRYQVFVEEEKNFTMRNDSGLETDRYDEYCEHLIVQDVETSRVIGTYRLLPGDHATNKYGFYSETEFDLANFAVHRNRTLELGRSCIAQEYRGSKAIQMLWDGIASFIAAKGYEYLIGCASIHIRNHTELLEIYSLLKNQQIITNQYGIKPLESHRIEGLYEIDLTNREKEIFRKMPPLMKGYQWLGAQISGDPAYDAIFETVDFLIILDKEKISRRYHKHFMQAKHANN